MRSAPRIRWLSIVLCLFWSFPVLAALQVNELEMQAAISEKAITLRFPVMNDSGKTLSVMLSVDLLDPKDNVVIASQTPQQLKPGRNSISLNLDRAQKSGPPNNEPILWYRVRYRLQVEGTADVVGIVALGAITPDMFELVVAHPEDALPNQPYHVRIHAVNPVTRRPVAGVAVSADLTWKASVKGERASKTTNAAGDANFVFKIPAAAHEGATVKIAAANRDRRQELSFGFDLDEWTKIIVSTDKPLYQPGQALHARALVLQRDMHALANEDVEFTLDDPDGSTVFSTATKTNDFGIASIDWDLPEFLTLGPYSLKVTLPGYGRYSESGTSVRVSRYNLPDFAVTATADRSYYLPGENASIEVSAHYLFGKEVAAGTVKLVREDSGHWDSTQRKWVTEEADQQTGKLDHSGKATFKVNLAKQLAELQSAKWEQFRDVNFVAYVTDASTGKTDQRRFQLRLTSDPVHIYLSRELVTQGRGSFYLSAYYADGTPCKCDVSIYQEPGPHYQFAEQGVVPGGRRFLRTVKTNRFGVAKVTGLPLEEYEDEGSDRGYHLVLNARDAKGVTVSHADDLWTIGRHDLQVGTDRAVYRENEPILVSLYSEEISAGSLLVDLSRDRATLWSGRVNLQNHRGFAVIPYQSRFTGELTVAAYSMATAGDSRYEIPHGATTILYPHDSTLNVKLDVGHNSYRPGDEVSATLKVGLPSGNSTDTALGVVVVDKAVDERLRTDQAFGGGWRNGFWSWSWWFTPENVGGLTLRDLYQFDTSEPIPSDVQVAAEVLLQGRHDWDALPEIESGDYKQDTQRLFLGKIQDQWEPLRKVVQGETATEKFPQNESELNSVLHGLGIAQETLVDPWGEHYRYKFGVDYSNDTLDVVSAGPDKKFDTSDDIEVRFFAPFFRPVGKTIDTVVKDTYASSGSYMRDFAALQTAMLAHGINLDTLRDPWGKRYHYTFAPRGRSYEIVVRSDGPNRDPYDIIVWTSAIDYFGPMRFKIDNALYENAVSAGSFPQDDQAFDALMSKDRLNFRQLVDPWGHPYYAKYFVASDYSDATSITYRGDARVQNATPVTRTLAWIQIFSCGPDGKPHTDDDFLVARYSREIAEQSGKELTPRPVPSEPLSGGVGAINGTVTDPSGATVSGARVVAVARGTQQKFTATTLSDGSYIVRNLPPGLYDVNISASGFVLVQVSAVPVHAASTTDVSVELKVGASSTTVEVTSASPMVQADTADLATVKSSSTRVQVKEQTFTTRLRDYFPETLFWSPSIITDSNGRAKVTFKLADNITTWKMTVLASTRNGEVGIGETEIQSFQPFFVEHDPPKILTVGDVIDLPVVVRNYLARPQEVTVEMKPAAWYERLQTGTQQVSVAAGESATTVFPFRATEAVKAGKQQIYAFNRTTGDAVEKAVTVHPDGLQQSSTAAAILHSSSTITLHVPQRIIPGSLNARLKIYPNRLAHVTESIEAGLERPYGCGEQTISAAYPALLLLKYYKSAGITNGRLEAKAISYVNLGYRGLLNFRNSSGGFSYWSYGTPNIALTAYAVRFLSDASTFIDVDPEVTEQAKKWLVSQQGKDGDWPPGNGYHDASLAAYVAATLAQAHGAGEVQPQWLHDAAAKALTYLSSGLRDMREPYTLAEFAMAASAAGDRQRASATIGKLETMAVPEHGGVYWALEQNTPFYGWGHAGRIESTAMVLLALSQVGSSSAESRRLIDAGTIWLLGEQDRYGVWYSGQATVDVLAALLSAMGSSKNAPSNTDVALVINGTRLSQSTSLPATSDAPVVIDITGAVGPGDNTIVVQAASDSGAASSQAVAEYYVPWEDQSKAESAIFGSNDVLRLAVNFDKASAQVGEEVRATIDAERIGSRGWGMMIAEVGLPPGVDVDRSSLEELLAKSDESLFRYDVLPDRVILYLWPKAGGSKLTFGFRARYGMQAHAAPSLLYDYYNPEAQVALRPNHFEVRAEPK